METTYALTIANDITCYGLTQCETQEGYITFTEYTQRCEELYNKHHSDEELPTSQRLEIMLECWKGFTSEE